MISFSGLNCHFDHFVGVIWITLNIIDDNALIGMVQGSHAESFRFQVGTVDKGRAKRLRHRREDGSHRLSATQSRLLERLSSVTGTFGSR